jgi:hypothetical protein
MRRGIETVPRDGKVVILEDGASGTYELAHWSLQAQAWIGENGKPIKIIPTHWHAMRRDADVLQEERGLSGPSTSQAPPIFSSSGGPQWPSAAPDVIASHSVAKPSPIDVVPIKSQNAPVKAPRAKQAGRRFALSSIASAMIASSLIGMYFRTEVTAYVTQYAGQHDILTMGTIGGQLVKQAVQFSIRDSHKADLLVRDAALPQQNGGSAQTATWEAVQITKTMAPEATQLLEKEGRRAHVSENELVEFRRSMDGRNLELQAAAAAAAQSLERDRGQENAALVQALAAVRQELTANEEKYGRALAEERGRGAALASELATARRDLETQGALSSKTGDEAAQLKQAAETATAELQQERDGARTLASELAMVRREVETQAALSSKTGDEAAQLKQAAKTATAELQQERDRAKTLESELAMARRDIETQVALSLKASAEMALLTQATKTATKRQQKPGGTEGLTSEPAMARQEVGAQAASSDRASEAAPLNYEVGTARAELRRSVQERDRGEPTDGVKPTRRSIGGRLTLERAANSQTTKVGQAVAVAGGEQLVAAEANGSLEAARLVERANALLGQGNIGAARVVLERAAERGSAQATFRLAETYDPLVLSSWGTYGTRGDATKARELYAKAYDGGIKVAKDRSNALLRGPEDGDSRRATKQSEIEAEEATHR